MIKIIKTESDYQEALSEIKALIERDPDPGTGDTDRLELLSVLIRDYESKRYPIESPDPVDVIGFVMDQRGLTQRDLIPYIGNRNRVSEILSKKRPLTLAMIRALESGLGIPAQVLLKRSPEEITNVVSLDKDRALLKEMIHRGWIQGTLQDVRTRPMDLINQFLSPLGQSIALDPLYKRPRRIRSARAMDVNALGMWTARIVILALRNLPNVEFRGGSVNLDFMRKAVQFSRAEDGPRLVREFLRSYGICLIIEAHLSRTHLDGAALMYQGPVPIIGLSLRYDRIDNFWFCLMHELAHVALHLGKETLHFYDDLDLENPSDPSEKEADQLAQEALIPSGEWEKSAASRLRTPTAIQHLADKLAIHPAIVAGRIRHEYKDYRVLNQWVGHSKVRKLFTEVKWEVKHGA